MACPHDGTGDRRDRPGHRLHPLPPVQPRRAHAGVGQLEHRQHFTHSRGGPSTTPPRSGATCSASFPRRCARRASRPRPRRGSASPTSARPPSSGTATPAARWPARSPGRTPAPRASSPTSPTPRRRSTSVSGLPLATLLRRAAAALAAGPRPGLRARARRRGRPLRDDGVLADLEPHRRPEGGRHVTDVTNASRTMLMDLTTLGLVGQAAGGLRHPAAMLPEIRANAEIYGTCTAVLPGVPIAGALGDQQAALVGQTCFAPGEAKCTYGTGAFLLMNTGAELPSLDARADPDRRLPVRRSAGVRAGGRHRHHRLAGAVVARLPRDDPAPPPRSRRSRAPCPTTAAATSSPPSPGCTRRTGTPTPGASWSG